MSKYKYNYKRKTLPVPLFEEDGILFYDCLFIYNNLDVGSLQIYIIGFPICYHFTDTTCEEAVKSRMIQLMYKNPHISSSEITKITGHSKPTIIRHYMTLKREIIGRRLIGIRC